MSSTESSSCIEVGFPRCSLNWGREHECQTSMLDMDIKSQVPATSRFIMWVSLILIVPYMKCPSRETCYRDRGTKSTIGVLCFWGGQHWDWSLRDARLMPQITSYASFSDAPIVRLMERCPTSISLNFIPERIHIFQKSTVVVYRSPRR